MEILRHTVLVLHFVGMAILVGGYLATVKSPAITAGMWHGALTQLVTGLILVGLLESADADVNHVKIGIKLLVAVAVAVLVFIGRRTHGSSAHMAHAVFGLSIINVVVAVFV